jgi:tRNA-(ms[2]io[6]A)-hydroxylase
MAIMLNLQAPTPERWLHQAQHGLEELLIDHAHCEKKASGVAMNLMFIHIENIELCRAMMEIVHEELDHFRQVLDLLARRGIRFRRIRPSRYGERLHALLRKDDPERSVDRLLVAALIEARSCERFGLLRDHLPDRELADFFGSLFESEARHHSTYVRLAGHFAPDEEVHRRLRELAVEEARIIAEGDDVPRMHS